MNNSDLDKLITSLLQYKFPEKDKEKENERIALLICNKAKEILSQEKNIVYLNAPITVSINLKMSFNRFVEIFMVNFMI